jgi:hypothetical protein
MTSATRDPARKGGRFYAAYGSNLSLPRMLLRCPGARRVGAGTLPDHRLTFRGVATIVGEVGATTPVAVYSITEADEAALDTYEGCPGWYYQTEVTVYLDDGREVRAMTYVLDAGDIEPPGRGYLGVIRDGYGDWSLDRVQLERAVLETRKAARQEAVQRQRASRIAAAAAPPRWTERTEEVSRYRVKPVGRLRRGDVVRSIVPEGAGHVAIVSGNLGRVRSVKHHDDGLTDITFGDAGTNGAAGPPARYDSASVALLADAKGGAA